MLTKDQLQFILRLTDFFHGHWEDPEWGKRPMNQLLIQLSTHTLANGIAEKGVRTAVQAGLEKSMASLAQQIASSQDPIPPAPHKK